MGQGRTNKSSLEDVEHGSKKDVERRLRFAGNYPITYVEEDTGLSKEIEEDDSTVYVVQDDLKSSSYKLFSSGFGRCNAIALLDKDKKLGTLAHISPATDPYLIVRGIAERPYRKVDDIRELYENHDLVQVINIYHQSRHSFSEKSVESEFNSQGFHNVTHIPLTTEPDPEWVFHRDVALDVEEGLLYVFPSNKPSNYIIIPFFK